MSHALIIEDNLIVSSAIEQQLRAIGFDSVDTAWTESQALDLLERHHPDLVVVGDDVAEGSSLATARQVSAMADVPILLATADSYRATQALPADTTMQGPFRLDRIAEAVAMASRSVPTDGIAADPLVAKP